MPKIKIIILSLMCSIVFSLHSEAAVSPLSVSFIPPVQFPPKEFTVAGFRLSVLWGHHQNAYGLDIGAVGNSTQQDFAGIGVSGIFNATYGSTTAFFTQAAGIANVNHNKTSVWGVHLAGAVNYNKAESKVIGLEVAAGANYVPYTRVYGFQVGLYNHALEVTGFQIGLINKVEALHGLQIGLINFNKKGPFAISPILNIGF